MSTRQAGVPVVGQVELCLPRGGARGWHLDLATALTGAAGTRVSVRWVDSSPERVRGLAALLAVERRLHGLRARGFREVEPAVIDAVCGPADGEAHLVRLDLAGGAGDLTMSYDGRVGEAALVDALRAGRFPVVSVVDPQGDVVASGRPGSEQPGVLAAALDDVLAGCVVLLVAAVAGHPPRLPVGDLPEPAARRTRRPAEHVLRSIADVGIRRAARAVLRTPHWRVGWRWSDGRAGAGSGADGGWRDLPDDGHHFYADPFPIVVDGRTFLFVEDFDHRVGRGVISVVEFGPDGPLGMPEAVLAHDVHLSYPVVLEDDGEIWMIPETSAAGRVELHRAVDFPRRWERHAVLLDGIDANDVTPFQHEGRWWLSATVRHGGSCSDTLHLWYADTLRGPWTPHAANPVVVDIASARPGGHLQVRDGRLLRPAQDGRGGYGSALTMAEIIHLDPYRFEQRIVDHLAPGVAAGSGQGGLEGMSWPGHRLHTLNRAGALEVIDGSARSWRLPR